MASATLRIRLLGELDLRHGEAAVPPLGSARAESLLAYLLLHREAPQPRQRLAFLLWPDSHEPQARTNLRHLLHNLRRALPDPDRYLEVTQRTLRWRDEAPCWLDVAAFEEAAARAERAGPAVPALREAVELYGGNLLQSSYDEWLLEERERLRRRYLEALERLAELLEAGGDHAGAIGYAERLLREDPLREATYRRLMRLHDARGDRARALRAYHACAAALERELNVEPSAATRRAYEALLPRPAGPAAGPLGRPPLVGRAEQRAQLSRLWRAAEGGGAQLVLVTGEPGAGKTRLVEELGSWCAHRGAAVAQARSYPAEGQRAVAPLRRVARPIADNLRPLPYLALQSMVDGGNQPGMHYSWRSQRVPVLADAVIDVICGLTDTITSPLSYVAGLVMGGAAGQVDPDATAVGERGHGFELSIVAGWPPPDPGGDRHTAWVRQGWTDLRPWSTGVYPHFISDEGAAGVEAAYGDRLKRLTALKDRYDPENLFRLNANIPPS